MTIKTVCAKILRSFGELHEIQHVNGKRLMTLAYLLPDDAWHLANGERSKLTPLVCKRPQRHPRITVESINLALRSIK